MSIIKGKLTDEKLRGLKVGHHSATGGLAIIVRGGRGSLVRSFWCQGSLGGKQLSRTQIGTYPTMPIAVALKKRDEYNAIIRSGKDPRVVWKTERTKFAETGGQPPKVHHLLDYYFKRKIEPQRHGHDTQERRFERIARARRHGDIVRKAIGDMYVADIEPAMLLGEPLGLEKRLETSVPSTQELARYVRGAFREAVKLGWLTRNPASPEILEDIFKAYNPNKTVRISLDWVDAPRFVAAVKAYKVRGAGKEKHRPVRVPPLLFLVYTGVRTEEVRKAKWGEIDRKTMLWNVPALHRKKGETKKKIRAIPISRAMLDVLEGMEVHFPNHKDDDLIFPGGSAFGGVGRGTINSFIRDTLKWDIEIHVHGFRATLSTWALAQRPAYDPQIIKAQFDQLKLTEDAEALLRRVSPSVHDVHYSHHNRPGMTDPTLHGDGGRIEMTEKYGEYLTSYQPPEIEVEPKVIIQEGISL
jgi:integrase